MSKKNEPIDINQIDLEHLKKQTSDSPSTSEYPLQVGSQAFQPTKTGAMKSRALSMMEEQVDLQMKNIFEQIQVLSSQVEVLKTRKKVSKIIYSCEINFTPVHAKDYFLYKTPTSVTLSMLSPEDFGEDKLKSQDWTYLANVHLLGDSTWNVKDSSPEGLELFK